MRRLALAALLLSFALVAGTARADTFDIVAPGADTPNGVGAIALPFAFTTPPSAPEQLSYPQLLGIWQRAGAAYGIQWQVLAAINKVESNFGRNMGPSSAGAIGWMQFMPSTWLRWGTDANGDGVADPWEAQDAIFSAARYLAAAGGATDIYRAVFAYNHADWYVQEVLDLAKSFGSNGTVAFTIDRVQENLDAARTAVVDANSRLLAAQRDENRLAAEMTRLNGKADRAALLSDRLTLQAEAGRTDERRAAAADDVTSAQAALDEARTALDRAEQAAAGASLQSGTSQLMAAPSYGSSGYVFPVGGGPGVVSVSHTHHDYPAADIAAPSGTPEYALADGVVVNAWAGVDARCGIGFTFRAFDGQVWTYCHMAERDPAVVEGANLTAGEPVGLVGQTGHATGPHLHLQLQPTTAWPQEEPWFQSFAGRAFTWQDGASDPADAPAPVSRALQFARSPETAVQPAPATSTPVFEVVPQTPRPRVVYFSKAGR